MSRNSQIVVLNETVRIQRIDRDDYISLTDIAKFKNADDPRFVIQNWMRTRSSIEFLGIWELLNNPDFNRAEFDTVKNQSGSNAFVMTPSKWTELTGRCSASASRISPVCWRVEACIVRSTPMGSTPLPNPSRVTQATSGLSGLSRW